jgi:pilus assembly protein CpaF
MTGFEVFLVYLPALGPLLEDDAVSEIEVNGRQVFVERCGKKEFEPIEIDGDKLRKACEVVASTYGGVEIGLDHPIADCRLPDGSRVAICLPPISVDGITLTIRKHLRRYFSLESLVQASMITHAQAVCLRDAVLLRHNILISGSTGSGKTTLLNALAACIPDDQRVIIIEDTTEIHVPQPNQRRFETQGGAVSLQQILKACLRHGPDRLLLGEIRGPEAYDLMQLLNTGHSGSLSTLHANSAELALRRFSSCVMQADVGIPYRAIRSDIADSIQWIAHLETRSGERRLRELVRVAGYDADADKYRLEAIS